ncbi:DUF4129 domain-containing protein [Halorientalis salina]|uniref:DUF4129 domain-containing protein n=1 Tax=Halorientalis salina TaxID=2932266 RepID=UPI00145F5A59|nr:DUF4129 domain-containing protein [Halorientalis salina]
MDRTALIAVLTAGCAAVAFAVGAAALDDAAPSVSVESPGGEVTAQNNTTAANDSGASGDSIDGENDGGDCVDCGLLDLRSLLAGYLPGIDSRLLFGVTALVVVGLGLAGLRRGETVAAETEEGEPDRGLDREPHRAGTPEFAAPDAEATNDVYRAWQRLVDRVEVAGPETTTPREYARRAVEDGFDPEAVDRLTDLFDRVRYGDAPPTERREQQARDAAERLDDGGER